MADTHRNKVLQHSFLSIELRSYKYKGICLYLQKNYQKVVNKSIPSVDRNSILSLIYLRFYKKIQKDLTNLVYRLYSQ